MLLVVFKSRQLEQCSSRFVLYGDNGIPSSELWTRLICVRGHLKNLVELDQNSVLCGLSDCLWDKWNVFLDWYRTIQGPR